MKKVLTTALFTSVFALFALPFASAEFDGDLLSKPHRIFEIGVDSNSMTANSSFGLKDVLKKHIELDLKKLADEMPNDGFSVAFNNSETAFINLNVSSRFRFSIFSGLESSGHFNIEKDIFDFLGNGMNVGEKKTVDVTGNADIFYNMGISFQTIIKGYGIKFKPSYFVPIAYVPKTTATSYVYTTEDGHIVAKAEANVDVYTSVDMHDFMEEKKSVDILDLSASNLLSNGGFDFAIEIERNWLHGLNAGLYTRIPLITGTLKNKMSTRVWAVFEETNALGYLNDTESHTNEHGHDDFVYSTNENLKVHRPLKLGLNATYMPFGDFFKIQPSVGLAVKNPFSSDSIFYPEYSLDFRLSLLHRIFNFNLGTAYQNQIFQQRIGFGLNLRVLEVIAQASMCGTNILASFDRNGYAALVGVRIGF
ncbi:hypothetical protein [uncultured Treponema sp.]|uniref:hypothetical protein n=1 Tax=uncultured Treponema sp. TaxID=162155 RepID=UPI0025DBBDC1|nr:hypothetical protein [uncultured Treponema sp.]